MNNRQLMDSWFQRVWVDQDMSAIDQIMRPDTKATGLDDAPQITGAEFRGFAEALLAQVTFQKAAIVHFCEDAGWAHMLVKFAGTARAGDAPCVFTAQIMARIVDGKIVEAFNHPDYISLFQQLGTLPPDLIARCLSGTRTA